MPIRGSRPTSGRSRGKLEKQERLRDAIAAFDLVRGRVPQAHLDIHGEGGESEALAYEATSGHPRHRDPAGRPSGFAASSESTRELVPRTCVRRGPVPPCASRGSSPATGAPTAPTSGTPRPPSARCPQPHRPPCRVRRTTPCSSWRARSSWPRLSRTRRPGEGVTASVLVWEKRRLADTVVPPQGGSATYDVSYDPRTGSRSARGDDRSDDLRACPAPCRPSRRSGVLGRPSRGRAGCGRCAHGRPQRVPGARYGCPPGKIFVVGRD